MNRRAAIHNSSQGQLDLETYSLSEAIHDACKAIGFKKIAQELWPEKRGELEASRYLSDCLNPDNARKLSGEQILYIAMRGRQEGIHILAAFFNREAGYAPPVAIAPEDERAELQKQFHADLGRLESLFTRMRAAGLVPGDKR